MKLEPIGLVRSPFKEQAGTPIQPCFATHATGEVIVEPPWEKALADLDGFDRVWLVYWFDRAAPCQPLIVPYRDTRERGLFATRAPARPNPIGISCVRLLGITGCVLQVAELDLLDGTPILDIKPYVPRFDAYPNAKAGWLAERAAERTVADERFEKK